MRPDVVCLCFIIVVFSNYMVLDAMYSSGGDRNGKRDNYHLQAGSYVTVYVKDIGAFAGHLYAPPVRTMNVRKRFRVKGPDGRRFFADLAPIQIEEKEHLKESRYFIQIQKTYLVSDKLILCRRPYNASALLIMLSSDYKPDYLIGGLGYYKGPVPLWTEETYNLQRIYNLQLNHSSGSAW